MRPSKPPYRVPTVAEIRAAEAADWDSRPTVASTFSGCGGSCFGYRMAGFRVVWANEFVPAAQESYRANASSKCILDPRDIAKVRPEEILQATGLAVGELDLFDGSPPCQAFSTVGKREKGWGKGKKYEHGAVQKNETLFTEYIRLLRGLKPKTFVAENVSGLVKGVAKGYFKEILADLRASGYRVEAKLLTASWLGVPQSRVRLIFQGVREDLGKAPAFPKPLPYQYTVRDAIPWALRHGTAENFHVFQRNGRDIRTTLVDSGSHPAPTIVAGGPNIGAGFIEAPPIEPEAWIDRFSIGKEWHNIKVGEKSDKYFMLQRADPEKPVPTIVALAGIGGIASATHPTECRKFSIAELKRLCGFPDDFDLRGTYVQQWERLGNSVPPVMMFHVASAIRDRVLRRAIAA